MADVINLNKVRKAKARGDAKAHAEANRARFGRSKGEKERDRIERERVEKALDGAEWQNSSPERGGGPA